MHMYKPPSGYVPEKQKEMMVLDELKDHSL